MGVPSCLAQRRLATLLYLYCNLLLYCTVQYTTELASVAPLFLLENPEVALACAAHRAPNRPHTRPDADTQNHRQYCTVLL
ncbi:hypothetical protein BCV70DRAFT_201558 [Testicularia cyperi]|uniref:Uncharacterized protein n=1 Tax=Testicularia cyperi TaxID=1882483 RepID=A0A317XLT8_9BASI|nr:hypothetical protein BCV70DRAFT_201558 [Testicularia cyperi]